MAKKKEKKEKKAGKRMSKKELAALLIDFFHAFPREAERYIFYLIGIHMEHMAKNRERRSASSEMFPGQARTRGYKITSTQSIICSFYYFKFSLAS